MEAEKNGYIDYCTYRDERLNNQIDWYDEKSGHEKKWYYAIKILQVIFSASIPVLTSFVIDFHWALRLIGVLGGLVTVLEGISSVMKFHEKWIQYRTISESLKREKYMFEASAGVYDAANTDEFKTLVERCETIISSENINWANMGNNNKGRGK
ncbi:DUF4231 domain-containing protein [Latilactobacillus curvatus]|uniref:DUF4231 domain-containing protein n=1 Tax=Latilactobacillus curvatus TaxID=28038 RepID=UPI0020C7F6A2|nr:DUF4231 domain-containing protein [Latilactobacillus curvatus]MCP8849146.1 DUF4231 domain-containing protein [Latilactobacillus curvatus]